MRISDWSSDVCSSDLVVLLGDLLQGGGHLQVGDLDVEALRFLDLQALVDQAVQHLRGQPAAQVFGIVHARGDDGELQAHGEVEHRDDVVVDHGRRPEQVLRSEEHTSELQSPMRISYAVFCLKEKNTTCT